MKVHVSPADFRMSEGKLPTTGEFPDDGEEDAETVKLPKKCKELAR